MVEVGAVVEVVVGTGVVEVVVVLAVVVVVVGELAEHVGTVMVLPSRVTAPFWAWTRPVTFAPVSSVADVRARIEPTNDVEVPSVADDPTCQKTLHAWAPPSRTTELPVAVRRVLPAWKIKTAAALPPAFKVKVPARDRELDDEYTPGARVTPPRVPAATVVEGLSP